MAGASGICPLVGPAAAGQGPATERFGRGSHEGDPAGRQRQFNKDLEKLVREHKDMGVDAEILDIMQQPSINRIK